MSQPAKAHEPSMEEILASIRRIIADDDSVKPAAVQQPAAEPPPRPAAPPPVAAMDQDEIDTMLASLDAQQADPAPEGEDVLDLTEQMAVPAAGEAPSFQTIDGQADVFFAEAPAEPPPRASEVPRAAEQPEMAEEPLPAPQPSPSEPRPLMSPATSAAVDSAFSALAQTVLVQNARTLEDLVREMLRPMLKSWLDDNLPGMVERIVRSEIERVSRGR